MTAVNLTEASGKALPKNFRCLVYAYLALRLRMMKMIFSPFSKFYMFRAKYYCVKEDDIDCNLEWILSSKGQSFLFDSKSWTFGQKTSNLVGEVRGDFSMDPLAYVSNYYRDEQLRKALSILLLPGQSTGTVQEALVTISDSEENNKRVPSGKLMLYQDPISHWWSSVLSISAHWMLNQVSEASHFYQEMDSVPFFQNEDTAAVGKVISSTCKAAKSIQDHHLFDRASHDLDVAAKYLRYSAEEEINLTNEELVMKVCNTLSML